MGIFSGTLLTSDVDGTLINYSGDMPQRNIEAIEYYIANGGLFTVATGRGVVSATRYIKRITHNCAPIVFNGSAIYDFEKQQFLWQHPLPDSVHAVVADILENCPDMGIQVYSELDMFVLKDSAVNQRMVAYEGMPYTYEKLEDITCRKWNKILCLSEEEKTEALIEYLKKYSPEDFHFMRTQKEYYEIVATGADKGSALVRLGQLYDIAPENIYAIGDYYNDVQLIEAAGYSAYTSGAPEELKPTANYIACDVDEGSVADFIYHIEKRINAGL